MIRKRIKKRRNPSEEELRERRLTGYSHLKLYLSDIIEYGKPEDLVNAIIKNTNFKNVKTIRGAIGLKITNPRSKPSKNKGEI